MRCPDDGFCHHQCTGSCFRVQHAGPLSGVYPHDEWPEEIRAAHEHPHLPRTDTLQEVILEALEIAGTLAPDALGDETKRPTLAWIISLAVREHEQKMEERSRLRSALSLTQMADAARGGAEAFHER